MLRTITIEMEDFPTTCFNCDFAETSYCWAKCPFIDTVREDGQPLPKDCPLKAKNKNKIYKYSLDKSFIR